jgi:hypothetical protein
MKQIIAIIIFIFTASFAFTQEKNASTRYFRRARLLLHPSLLLR